MFTHDNFDGATDNELSLMNRALDYFMADYRQDSPEHEQHEKRFSDRIINNLADDSTFESLIR